jgi:hypothetical protein
MLCGKPVGDCERSIGGTIVHDDDFTGIWNRQQARDDFRQRSFFVVGWHNNGKQWLAVSRSAHSKSFLTIFRVHEMCSIDGLLLSSHPTASIRAATAQTFGIFGNSLNSQGL